MGFEEPIHRTRSNRSSETSEESVIVELQPYSNKSSTKESVKEYEGTIRLPDGKIFHVAFLGFTFMLLYTAYNPVQNMISLLFEEIGEKYLGIYALFVGQLAFAAGSLLAPQIAAKFSYRIGFFIGAFGFVLLIAVGKFASFCSHYKDTFMCQSSSLYVIVTIASCAQGQGSSLIWYMQSLFIFDCSNENNKGRMFGIFMALMQVSQISGAIIATIGLREFGTEGFFMFQTFLSFFSALLFLFVKTPVIPASIHTFNNKDKNNSEMLGIEPAKATSNIKRLIDFSRRDKMQSFRPPMLLVAFAFAFMVGAMPKLISLSLKKLPQTEINEKVGLIFLVLGCSEVIASQVSGRLYDRNRQLSVKAIIFFNLSVLLINLIAFKTSSYHLYFAAALCFGFCDAGAQIVFSTLLTSKFVEKSEPQAVFRSMTYFASAGFILLFMILEQFSIELQFLSFAIVVIYAWRCFPQFA